MQAKLALTRLNKLFYLPPVQYYAKFITHFFYQCSGSVIFLYGSGSADPYHWIMDPDPESESCSFLHRPSRCQHKLFFSQSIFFLFTVGIQYLHLQSHNTVEMMDFLSFLNVDGRIRIRTNNIGFVSSGDPKTFGS